MYRFLLSPRWLALHVLVLVIIPAFVFLGRWQFGRFEERSAASTRTSSNMEAAPAPLARLDTVGGAVPESLRFRTVTATGHYDATHELLVRRRTQNSRVGFLVITPLITPQGAVLVNRGWVAAGATADTRPEVPPPPSGDVTVTGRLRPAETEDTTGLQNRAGLPKGQILIINTADIGAALPYRLFGGFVELTGQQPSAGPVPELVPAPDVGGGGGLNLAYGVQWWLFIGVAIGGWVFLIRREAHDLKAVGESRRSSDAEAPAAVE